MITRRSLFASLAGLAVVPAGPSLAEQAKDIVSDQFHGMAYVEKNFGAIRNILNVGRSKREKG